MTEVRETFDRLLADEPPMVLGLAPVVAAGRRMRRRQRARYALAGAAASLTLLAGGLAAGTRDSGTDRLEVSPFRPLAGPAAPVPPAPATVPAGLTPRQRRIAEAIVAASPDGWAFELGPDRWSGASSVEATADDGAGPGRLLIGVSTSTQLLHPCREPDFRQGAACTERVLPGGSVLSLRERVDARGLSYVDVVLTHPDGSGVMAESGSYTIPWPLPRIVSPEQKRELPRPSRPGPTYTTAQLADVVLAVDAAVR